MFTQKAYFCFSPNGCLFQGGVTPLYSERAFTTPRDISLMARAAQLDICATVAAKARTFWGHGSVSKLWKGRMLQYG